MPQAALDQVVIELLKDRLTNLEAKLKLDCVSLFGPIVYGVEQRFNQALSQMPGARREGLAIILDTPGGVVEVAERMVQCSRHFYKEVVFIVPNQAMSAGTVFAMSGDKIMMNYYSVLGPIDPQIQKDGKLIPALSYLSEYESLVEKSKQGLLTTAEYALVQKFDLGELHTFKQARDLSVELLENWLSTYKFKDWHTTENRKLTVDPQMRKDRAKQIAIDLMNHEKWHSHSRCIPMKTLIELNIKIEDYGVDKDISDSIHSYFDVFVDFLSQKNVSSFVHSAYYI